MRKRSDRHLCKGCRQSNALYVRNGHAKFRADHELCPRCYRSLLDASWSQVQKARFAEFQAAA